MVRILTPGRVSKGLNIGESKGVIVKYSIQQGSPADEADMRAGDIIREINRKPVRNVNDFREIVGKARTRGQHRSAGKEGEYDLLRRNEKRISAGARRVKRDEQEG